MDNNRFKEVPPALFDIPNLEKILMNRNYISTVPFSMWTAPKLTDLLLAHNQLAELPNSPEGDALIGTNGGSNRSNMLRERRSVGSYFICQSPQNRFLNPA